MAKEHHFVVVAIRGDDGVIHYSIDSEFSVSPDGPEYSVWNIENNEWETVQDNMLEDNAMYNELRRILSKDYDMGPLE